MNEGWPWSRYINFLQLYSSVCKEIFWIYPYYFSGFPFVFHLFSNCCPCSFFHIVILIILVCIVKQTRIFNSSTTMLLYFFIERIHLIKSRDESYPKKNPFSLLNLRKNEGKLRRIYKMVVVLNHRMLPLESILSAIPQNTWKPRSICLSALFYRLIGTKFKRGKCGKMCFF